MDFLTNRPQHVKSGHNCSSTITLNTGAPQGCVLSPFLYSLFTHDCRPMYGSNSITKFADDITVIGLITKLRELIVDFRKVKRETHDPIHINGMAVECVSSFRFLGIHISENLSLTANTSSLIKKAHQRLFFLRTLKKNHLSTAILGNFYRCVIESILTNCIHSLLLLLCREADFKHFGHEKVFSPLLSEDLRHRFFWTSSMAGSGVFVMRWAVFTTLCSALRFRDRAVPIPDCDAVG
ncbi:hypothetical protein L3Q82_011579 [Scortum barcoo]|uniref:Uncharacterized protein n=1 Tax=Scortum barcoo TaxID=214431 RepID=A0ACB8W778_9TELE|nr:hypothetical protein L3Q82_011579 [Scortum barcoo]